MINHSERAHALLSASGASKWMNCTPSAIAEESFENETSDFAEEGTVAHELAEQLVLQALGLPHDIDKIKAHRLYKPEMDNYLDGYVASILEKTQLSDEWSLEAKLSLEPFIPEGFATSDFNCVEGDTLTVMDLKYGKGLEVSAFENKQLRIYALGALSSYALSHDIKTVVMEIHQPRLHNHSVDSISTEELYAWAMEELVPKAKIAFGGEGERVAGSHCKFCRAKPTCTALAEMHNELAKLDFEEPNVISDTSLIEIYEKAEIMISWLKSIESYMVVKALRGKEWKGYKLVTGQSRRKIINEKALKDNVLTFTGLSEADITNHSLKTITELERLIPAKTFRMVSQGHVVKPQGAAVLVPQGDKRARYKSAESDFLVD
jgi:hypothetical protein